MFGLWSFYCIAGGRLLKEIPQKGLSIRISFASKNLGLEVSSRSRTKLSMSVLKIFSNLGRGSRSRIFSKSLS